MSSETPSPTPVALTVAGSDSGGNAGIQMDLAVFRAMGVHGLTAITCLTSQNPDGVKGVHAAPAHFVEEQLAAVSEWFTIGAAKTGMLFEEKIIERVVAFFGQHPNIPLVVDPVMVASSGAVLLQDEAIASLRDHLLPKARLVTPNLDEVKVFLGKRPETPGEMREAGKELVKRHGVAFLLKGGHLGGSEIVDLLITPDGVEREYPSKRIHELDTHGSGCLLSSAITAGLAGGLPLESAVEGGLRHFRKAAENPVWLSGTPFLRPLV